MRCINVQILRQFNPNLKEGTFLPPKMLLELERRLEEVLNALLLDVFARHGGLALTVQVSEVAGILGARVSDLREQPV